MIRCVICYVKFEHKITLESIFEPIIYCPDCYEKLIKVYNSCKYCSHPLGYNCCNKSITNISLYHENQFLKDVLYQIKYYNLANKLFIFKNDIELFSRNYTNYSVIPVPLSSIMNNKRGFNQSYILASFTKLKILSCLIRTDNITQSTKTYFERINNPPKFELKYLPKNKNLIIVDDIYTTGATMKQIVSLFPKNYHIICLTIQRTILK
ncbi:MAG: ComF family protein [Bacilli bacterium]